MRSDGWASGNGAVGVKAYFLYIHDDRYAVPALDCVTAQDDRHAIQLAMSVLGSSSHHDAVEIWEEDRFVWRGEQEGRPMAT